MNRIPSNSPPPSSSIPKKRRYKSHKKHNLNTLKENTMMTTADTTTTTIRHRATAGFLSTHITSSHGENPHSIWFIYLAEFFGSVFYAMIRTLFVAGYGGSLIASAMPSIFGTGFSDGFAYLFSMITFGMVSGGHYNPAITLAVIIMEIMNALDFLGTNKTQKKPKGHAWWTLIPFFLIQFLAFILVALLIWLLTGASGRASPIFLGTPVVSHIYSNARTFSANFIGSSMMISAYLILLKVFYNRAPKIQILRSLAFGVLRLILVFAFAPWSGALWNASLWLALAIVSGYWDDWWLLFFPSLAASFVSVALCLSYWCISRQNKTKTLLNNK